MSKAPCEPLDGRTGYVFLLHAEEMRKWLYAYINDDTRLHERDQEFTCPPWGMDERESNMNLPCPALASSDERHYAPADFR